MMTKGNLGDVRAALQELRIGDVVDSDPINPLQAEIVAGVTPAWHVLETQPNHERSVAAHLIARRFGVFVPESEHDIIRRGRKLHVTRLMFTGYVFVFVWDIGAHWSRLESIPGVARIMRHPGSDGLQQKPVVIADALIDQIRAVENAKRPLPAIMISEVAYRKKNRKRWRRDRRDRREIEEEKANEIVAVRSWSAFQDAISSLDESGRNGALLNALGLPS